MLTVSLETCVIKFNCLSCQKYIKAIKEPRSFLQKLIMFFIQKLKTFLQNTFIESKQSIVFFDITVFLNFLIKM